MGGVTAAVVGASGVSGASLAGDSVASLALSVVETASATVVVGGSEGVGTLISVAGTSSAPARLVAGAVAGLDTLVEVRVGAPALATVSVGTSKLVEGLGTLVSSLATGCVSGVKAPVGAFTVGAFMVVEGLGTLTVAAA